MCNIEAIYAFKNWNISLRTEMAVITIKNKTELFEMELFFDIETLLTLNWIV